MLRLRFIDDEPRNKRFECQRFRCQAWVRLLDISVSVDTVRYRQHANHTYRT